MLNNMLPSRYADGLRALVGVGSTVFAVQGLSFVANLLVIRELSVSEYAILTSSLSILGVLGAIADSGISQAAITLGGVHHEDVQKRAEILRACRSLVLKAGLAGASVVLPVWVVMMFKLTASPVDLLLAGASLFGGFFLVIGINVYRSFLLLDGKRILVQKWDVAKTIIRLLLLAVGVSVLPSAAYVIVAGFAAEFTSWIAFRKALAYLRTRRVSGDEIITKEVNSVFFRMMPASVYKAVSSQLFLVLLILFGSAGSVAGAGALGKFHQFFLVIPQFTVMFLSPQLARMKGVLTRNLALARYTAVAWCGAILLACALAIFATPLLSLFGANYIGLEYEMRLIVIGSCLFIMATVLSTLCNTRGWIVPPRLVVGVDICAAVIAIVTCNVSQLSGFAMMNIIVHGSSLLVAIAWSAYCYMFKSDVSIIS